MNNPRALRGQPRKGTRFAHFVFPSLLLAGTGCLAPTASSTEQQVSQRQTAHTVRGPAMAPTPDVSAPDPAACPAEDALGREARLAVSQLRATAGLQPLRCDTAAAAAAAAHCGYLAANPGPLSHLEESGRPGFTGVTFQDRLAAQHFGSVPSGELMATITGTAAVNGDRGWMNSVYHRAVLLRAENAVFGYGHTGACSTMDLGRSLGGVLAKRATIVWPPNGATGVPTTFHAAHESPNPVPGRSVVGSPVSIFSQDSFAAVSVTMRGPEGRLEADVLTSRTDPTGLLRAGDAHLVPHEPLRPYTRYTVVFVLTHAGVSSPSAADSDDSNAQPAPAPNSDGNKADGKGKAAPKGSSSAKPKASSSDDGDDEKAPPPVSQSDSYTSEFTTGEESS